MCDIRNSNRVSQNCIFTTIFINGHIAWFMDVSWHDCREWISSMCVRCLCLLICQEKTCCDVTLNYVNRGTCWGRGEYYCSLFVYISVMYSYLFTRQNTLQLTGKIKKIEVGSIYTFASSYHLFLNIYCPTFIYSL